MAAAQELQETNEWQNTTTYREQVSLATTVLHFRDVKASFRELEILSGRTEDAIYREYDKGLQDPRPVDHPSDLTSEGMNQLEQFVTNGYMSKRPATYERIADYLECELGVVMNVDALRHVVARNPNLKCVVGRPMERERVEVAIQEIEAFYERLQTMIPSLPASFIVNTHGRDPIEYIWS
jgi:hypothetical protein